MVAFCCLEDNALGWWLWPSGLWPLGLGHPMDTTHCHGFSFCQIESGTRQTSRNSRGKLSPHPYVLNLTWNSSQTHWNQSCSKLFLFFAMFHQQMICQNIVWDFPWVHEIFHELASKFEELDERCDPIGEQECCFFHNKLQKIWACFILPLRTCWPCVSLHLIKETVEFVELSGVPTQNLGHQKRRTQRMDRY